VRLEPRPSRIVYSDAVTHFARAIGAARSGDPASARPDVDKLQALQRALADAKQSY
jgi:hypothetical protein